MTDDNPLRVAVVTGGEVMTSPHAFPPLSLFAHLEDVA